MELEISKEKGEFSLFMLLHREEGTDKYDLIVSAPWLEVDKRQGLEYLVEKVQSKLNRDELLTISRIVILEKDNPTLAAVLKAINVKQGDAHVKDTVFYDTSVSQAFISTSTTSPTQFR